MNLESFAPIGMFGVFIAFVVIVVLASRAAAVAQKREDEWLRSAGFVPMHSAAPGCLGIRSNQIADEKALRAAFGQLSPLNKNSGGYCSRGFFADRGDYIEYLFTFTYTTGSGKNQQTHTYLAYAVQQAFFFTDLSIGPADLGDSIVGFFGVRDIQFESDDFNKRFRINSSEPKFAYDVIHPQMMEFFEGALTRHWEFSGPFGACVIRAYSEAPECQQFLREFMSRVPDYLRQERALPKPEPLVMAQMVLGPESS